MVKIRENYNKKNIKMRFVLLLILTFSVWTFITIFNQWIDYKDIKIELVKLEAMEQDALAKKSSLETEVLLLKNNEYIAEIARRNYFLSKSGEIIIISPEHQ
ncbi:MAG: septum formation initiator family protein [Vulcanibacillus sp.]